MSKISLKDILFEIYSRFREKRGKEPFNRIIFPLQLFYEKQYIKFPFFVEADEKHDIKDVLDKWIVPFAKSVNGQVFIVSEEREKDISKFYINEYLCGIHMREYGITIDYGA